MQCIVLMPGWILASFPVAPKVIKNWTVGRHGNEARWNVCLLIIVLYENALHECDLINATRATLRSGKSSLVTFSDCMVLYYCGLAMETVCSRSRSLLCYNFRTRLHVHFLLVSQARPFPFRSADRFPYGVSLLSRRFMSPVT